MEKGVEIFVDDPIIYDKSEFYSEMDDKCDLFFRIAREWDVTLSEMFVYVNLNEHDDTVIYHGYSVKRDLSELFTGLDHSVRVIRFSKIRDMIRTKYTKDNAVKTLEKLEREPERKDDDEEENEWRRRRQDTECDEQSKSEESSEERKPEVVILHEIRQWLKNTSFTDFCDAITDIVMGQPQCEIVVMNIYNYLRCIADGKKHNNNMLLAAPSGTGKTETYRAIREYFRVHIPDLVIFQTDMTSVTEEGFTGRNTKDIVQPLKNEDKGIAIAFLDEFDKKLIPSFAKGGDNVNLAVQSQILTLIEGRMLGVKDKDDVDTSNTLFIGMGAFNECRRGKSEATHFAGFSAVNSNGEKHYSDITREDMIKLGASYELIGRFSTIVNYHELSYEIVDSLIDRFTLQEVDMTGCNIVLGEEMRNSLHESANGEYGCRILKGMIHEGVLKGNLVLCKAGADLNLSTVYINSVDNVEVDVVIPDDYPEDWEELPDDEEDEELEELLGLDSDDCIDWDDDE